MLLLLLLLLIPTTLSNFYPSPHLINISPVRIPPKFTNKAKNTRHARRVQYFAPNIHDIFDDEGDIAYGGVLGQGYITDPPIESSECVGVTEAALRLLHLPLLDLQDITFCRRHLLRVTNDHGKSGLILPIQLASKQGNGLPHYTDANVAEGINYFLRLNVAGNIHQITLNYDRQGKYNIYQHTIIDTFSDTKVDKENATTTETETEIEIEIEIDAAITAVDSPQSSSLQPPPLLKILTLNVWNTNPPGWSAGEQRNARYRKRIHLLASVINNTKADIIGLQEVRYDSTIGKNGELKNILFLFRFKYLTVLTFDIFSRSFF